MTWLTHLTAMVAPVWVYAVVAALVFLEDALFVGFVLLGLLAGASVQAIAHQIGAWAAVAFLALVAVGVVVHKRRSRAPKAATPGVDGAAAELTSSTGGARAALPGAGPSAPAA